MLCVFSFLPPLGSPCALAGFVSPARPFAVPWWLLPPLLFPLCVSRFSSLPLGALLFFFLFLSGPPLSRALSGFRPRVPWALALCFVCFVGLPLPGSPCALASFVCLARLLAAPWWFLPPPPSFVSRGFCRCRSVLRSFFLLPALCASVVSALFWFPAPGALGLGAVRCLPCWPPASRLSVRSRLSCAARLAAP